MLTYHVYRNGRLKGLTVPPAETPMWPGSPLAPDHLVPMMTLGNLLEDSAATDEGEEPGGGPAK